MLKVHRPPFKQKIHGVLKKPPPLVFTAKCKLLDMSFMPLLWIVVCLGVVRAMKKHFSFMMLLWLPVVIS